MTQFHKALYDQLLELQDQIYNPTPNHSWVLKHSRIRGKRISFKGRFFQQQILDDMHDNLCCIKISQIGLTEIQIQKALMFCVRNPHRKLIFSLPDQDMRDRIVQTRVYPLIETIKVFRDANQGRVRSLGNIGFNNSFLMFLPAIEKAATSQDADFTMNDEVDLSDQAMLALFNSRLQGSDLRINQRFSTPTFTGFGIDADFNLSDQHLFLYKCHKCNHWQDLEFNRKHVHIPNLPDGVADLVLEMDQTMIDNYKLDFSKAYYHCSKCKAPVDLTRPELRNWVAKHPSRAHHRGYKVSLFSVDNLPPSYVFKQLLKYKKDNYIRGFYNTVLGQAYTGGDSKITEDEIKSLFGSSITLPYNPAFVYTIGVDMGQICHITIAGSDFENDPFTALHEQCPVSHIEYRVKELCEEYRVVLGLTDRHPYEPTSTAIMHMTQGVVIPCEYSGSARFRESRNQVDGSLSHVTVNRTLQLDLVSTRIKKRTITLNGYNQFEGTLVEHLQDLIRIESPDKQPVWEKITGHDHFFHSAGYALQAMEQYALGFESVESSPSVLLMLPVQSEISRPKLLGGLKDGSSTFKIRR